MLGAELATFMSEIKFDLLALSIYALNSVCKRQNKFPDLLSKFAFKEPVSLTVHRIL